MDWDPPIYFYDDAAQSDDHGCYTVLHINDIRYRQTEAIYHISSVLSIDESAAIALLHHSKWNVSQLLDQWFSDEQSVREIVGVFETDVNEKGFSNFCGICFDYFPIDQLYTANCTHTYCETCWKGYISTSINDSGLGNMSLRCPDPSCAVIVGKDMIFRFGSREEREKYSNYVIRSYVESKRDKIKWCPAPGCENAVEFEVGSSNVYDVMCECGHGFCWKCVEDAHRPVDCETVGKWMALNRSEGETNRWIMAYSKPCPKCKRPIEKNHGCNHIICSQPCRHEFCWLCLGDYKKHGSCNVYFPDTEGAKWKDEDEKRRIEAQNFLERYTHYYERWSGNQRSRQKAKEGLHKMQTVHLKILSDNLKMTETQLKFIVEAWQQIVECRRVLKWTYAYGYYIPQEEHNKKQLFECLQGEAEVALERLHRCTERELAVNFLCDGGDVVKEDFDVFQPKLIRLTSVTRLFFENLVKAWENGLSEVGSSQSHPPTEVKGQKGTSSTSSSSSDQSFEDHSYD